MNWARVQSVRGAVVAIPALSASVTLPAPVLAGDLVVVGCTVSGDHAVLAVTDDGPAGGNAYGVVEGVPDIFNQSWLFLHSAVVAADVGTLTVTVANTDAVTEIYTLAAGTYRSAAPFLVGPHGGNTGRGDRLTMHDLVAVGSQSLEVALGQAYFNNAQCSPLSPLALQYYSPVTGLLAFSYADCLNVHGTVSPAMRKFDSTNWILVAATWGPMLPPPPRAPLPFFSGGTQPAPVYYKQEGGPLLSRPLRRRLRSEGFHV